MKTQIDPNSIFRIDADNINDNIIGVAACLLQDNTIHHAGIFIRYNSTNYLLHFDKEKVELLEIKKAVLCFFKRLSYIPSEIIPSTYLLFKRISMSKKPGYSYFYDGSCYEPTNIDFFDEYEMPEIMSCVGFCLNVLKTVLNREDFIKYTDWHYHNGITEDKVKKYFESKIKANYPNIDIVEFCKHSRRILPIEYFTAGFSTTIPVEKLFTDANIKAVENALISKIAS